MGNKPEPSPRPGWRRRLVGLAVKGALVYLGVVILMLFLENSLLFPATRASSYWATAPSPQIQDVELTTADGVRLHAWWLPVKDSQGALLYCHGNGGNLSMRGPAILAQARELDVSVLIFDYPGYGKSEGRPGEQACYAAADAAYDWLTTQGIAPEEIILYGKSLGGGVATELATRRPHRALVLAKTFTSIPDLAQELYPWLPARWLMRNRFDNLAKIGRCPRPVLITYGDCDSLIRQHHSEKLHAAAREPKHLEVMPGCEHNSSMPAETLRALRVFLDTHAPVKQAERAAAN
jgi:pimeloyl-ACP methyl ester carboxylesterase